MNYDQEYGRSGAYFGADPEALLVQFVQRFPVDLPILDVGAGQGRNAFFAAARGVTVHALEPAPKAAAALRREALRRELPLEVFSTTFEQFQPPVPAYGGVLVFGLIPDLDREGVATLLRWIRQWSRPGALLMLTGFTTADPAYAQHRAQWREIAPHSFRSAQGRVRTYLEAGEILRLLGPAEVLHHWEGLGPEHRHGDGPVERHGRFEVVARR